MKERVIEFIKFLYLVDISDDLDPAVQLSFTVLNRCKAYVHGHALSLFVFHCRLEQLRIQEHLRGVPRKKMEEVNIPLVKRSSFRLVENRKSAKVFPLVNERHIGQAAYAEGIERKRVHPGVHDRVI